METEPDGDWMGTARRECYLELKVRGATSKSKWGAFDGVGLNERRSGGFAHARSSLFHLE